MAVAAAIGNRLHRTGLSFLCLRTGTSMPLYHPRGIKIENVTHYNPCNIVLRSDLRDGGLRPLSFTYRNA